MFSTFSRWYRQLNIAAARRRKSIKLNVEQLEDRLAPASFSTLVAFDGSNGTYPQSALVQDAQGDLFGTTADTVFELANSNGSYTLKTLYTLPFPQPNTIQRLAGNLVSDAHGNLYGMTQTFATIGYTYSPVIFELVNNSGNYTFQTLYSLDNSFWSASANSLAFVDAQGDVFGTTVSDETVAGAADDSGRVFELVNGNGGYTFKTLYTFSGSDGSWPASVIPDGQGNLFGTAVGGGLGGDGDGTVFELVNTGGSYALKTLYSFPPTTATDYDGNFNMSPNLRLVMDANGDLFGTHAVGGAYGFGMVFELANNGGSYNFQILHSFTGAADGSTPTGTSDGNAPIGIAQDANGDLFGTTFLGGADGRGTVFELVNGAGGYTFQTLHTFTGGADGGWPSAGVTVGAQGQLFGITTLFQNSTALGTVFQVIPDAALTLPTGAVGSPYSVTLTPNDNGYYTFAVLSGTLPPGLALNAATDTLTGTPNQVGTFTFYIEASPTFGQGASIARQYTLTIDPAIAINPATLPTVTVGQQCSIILTASGGSGTGYTYSESGPLDGLTLINDSDGTASLWGTPAQPGQFTFTVTATDSQGNIGRQTYTLTAGPAITISPATLPSGTVGVPYAQTLTVSGGNGGPYTFSEWGGDAPGLYFNTSTGQLSGTPTQTGTFVFDVVAKDSQGDTGYRDYTLTIGTALTAAPTVTDVDPSVGSTDGGTTVTITGTNLANASAVDFGTAPGTILSDSASQIVAMSPAGKPGTVNVTVTTESGISAVTPADHFRYYPQHDQFVSNLYEQLLKRAPDPDGLAYWAGQLDNGVAASTVVQDIMRSTEYLQDKVNGLYLQFLDRNTDPGGLQTWTGLLAGGGSLEQVIQGLVSSPEYFALHGNSDSGFVSALYQGLLGRTGSDQEVRGWVNAMNHGATRSQAVMGFLKSSEYLTNQVASFYASVLNRSADPSGQAAWANALASGAMSDETVEAAFWGSAEAQRLWSR